MKKTIKTITTAMALTLILGLSSCKKGDTGPAGPAGTNGTNGVANIATYVATTTNASWSLNASEYSAIINVSGINSNVVSNGGVMVFLGNTAQTSWAALPFSYQNVEFGFEYSLGQVTILVTYGNGATPSNPGGIPFKVVVIPPSKMIPNVNIKNYEDVKKAYNLAD